MELKFSLKKILGKLLIKYCMQTTLTASCIIQILVGVLETTGFKRKLGKRRKLEGLLGEIVLFFTQAKHHLACLYSSIWWVKQDLVSVHFPACVCSTCIQGVHTVLALWLKQYSGSYIDRLSASVFDSDPGLLNHVQIGPCHHQGGMATEEDTIYSTGLNTHVCQMPSHSSVLKFKRKERKRERQ